jgi:hypothetical protein
MLKQRPTLDITRSNRYQVRVQDDQVKSRCIQSARENIAEFYHRHRFESATERFDFIDSLLADIKYLFLIAEHVEAGVRGPNLTLRGSKATNEWLASISLPGGSYPAVYLLQISSSVEYPR